MIRSHIILGAIAMMFAVQLFAEDKPLQPSKPVAATKPVASAKPAAASKPAKQVTSSTATNKPANDRLILDTTTVTGNRELPKVLYIVPWKRADVGALPERPFNTLLDETFTPVDREVFRRQVDYYQAISSKDQPGRTAAPTSNSNVQPAPPAGAK